MLMTMPFVFLSPLATMPRRRQTAPRDASWPFHDLREAERPQILRSKRPCGKLRGIRREAV
jgi:hypothetical protein